VAPNTGGESFGIILAEAMAAGTATVASDIPAFASLLGEGEYGSLFRSEDSSDLATRLITLLTQPEIRLELATAGQEHAEVFDWDNVAAQIFSVYEMAMVGSRGVRLASDSRPWNRFLSRETE
jgi:phosphatidylinositol alpha-mannosyltransferase